MSDFDPDAHLNEESGSGFDPDAHLDNASTESTLPASHSAPTKVERYLMGFGDIEHGLGQITEHVAETPLNALRWTIRKGLHAVGATEAEQLFQPVSTNDFDGIIQRREQEYQQARAQAGQTGIDWWRLAGGATNPLNFAMPGGAAGSVAGRIAQAAGQGAAVAAAQPSTTPGDFWWDKAKNVGVGAATGAVVSGLIEGTVPLIRSGVNAAKKALGGSAAAADTAAADAVVNGALNAKGVDPNSVDLNVLAGLKQEAQSALDHDAEPSAEAIANRARAESLPVPVKLMRGQATGDAMAFSREQNLRGITGVGEPLTQRLQEQNAAFVQNLDALGAKNAPDTVSTSQQMADKIQSYWDTLQTKKDALYSAVRNSRGQPAVMDQFTAAQQIRDALDTPQASHAWDALPANIQRTIGDLEDGKLPLTVAQMQSLDKAWNEAARGADGSARYAINAARRILNDAPIQDEVGQEARQAYQAARTAHAQQMSLIDPKLPNGRPNPNFQPMMKAIVEDGKPPESLFQTHFLKSAPSVAQKNMAFIAQLDPNAPETIGRTLMGEIKREALSSASDERGTVSQAVLNSWANDPVKSARLDALLPKPAVDTFHNLAATVEAAKRYPVASTVNTSNTGSAVVNAGASMLKQGAGRVLRSIPGVRQVAQPIQKEMENAAQQTAVKEALSPGVTLKSLFTATPSQAARRSLTARLAIPGAIATEEALQGGNNE